MSFPPGLLRGAAALSLVDSQEFWINSGSGTNFIWTKPQWARLVYIHLVGAGGGGGGGGATTGAVVRMGGAGGGGGACHRLWTPADALASQVAVNVGSGGAGGLTGGAGAVGQVGGNGTSSSFGTVVFAWGGGGGRVNFGFVVDLEEGLARERGDGKRRGVR